MAAGSSKQFATKALDCDEEFSEFCENFSFSDSVNSIPSLLRIKINFHFVSGRTTTASSAMDTTGRAFASPSVECAIRLCFITKDKSKLRTIT